MADGKPLNLLDLGFVVMETRQTPMHVAGLQIFRPPHGAPRDFARTVYEYLRGFPVTAAPFTYVLRGIGAGRLVPRFEPAKSIALDHHLCHSALPSPGGERELGVLVSRLHSIPLDFARPLWEVHLIEGLPEGRFALYGKLHHSLADGVSGVGLLNFSEDAGASDTAPFWAADRPDRPGKGAGDVDTPGTIGRFSSMLRGQAQVVPELVRGLMGSARAALGAKPDPDFASLAEAPRTLFNVDVTPQRRVATQSTSLARMKAIGEAAGGSVNDVLLAACGGALRRYLLEQQALPRQSLIASIPVAFPRDVEQAGGNAISFANVKLGTDLADVRERYELVRRSSAAGREYLKQMSPAALMAYTVLISSPQMLTRIPALGARVPPIYNLIVSNVRGPRRPLYFMGAEMEAYYPVSALAHGQALNITVLSYAGGLYFGFTGCADKLPHLQRLALYTGEALDELEREFARARGRPARRARPTGSKSRSKPATGGAAAPPRKGGASRSSRRPRPRDPTP